MANAIVTVACLTGLLVSTAHVAQAQYAGEVPREGACFYRDADHRGRSFCIQSGDQMSSLPGGFDDEVSSIRTYGRVEVLVYRDTRFRGDSRQFTSNVRDLQNEDFNDRISSVEVRRRGGWGGGSGGGSSSQNPERTIRRAYQDVLQREPDQAGMRLYRSRIIDDGWSEQQVREALRNSPEYKQLHTMTWPKAQEIVRRAYLNVLNREPDPGGSRGYVERVFKDKWTQADVERELRKSPEYRQR